MYRRNSLIYVFSFIILLSSSAFGAAEGTISLDHIDGNVDGSEIGSGEITFYFKFEVNATSDLVKGYSNGFKIYSPNGLTWDPPTGVIESDFAEIFDLISSVNYYSDDGMGEDTIGFGGSVMLNSGLSPGDTIVAFQITTATQIADNGKMICIDSSFYPPTAQWLWSASGGLTNPPDWGGPYCYTVNTDLDPKAEGLISLDHIDGFVSNDTIGVGPITFNLRFAVDAESDIIRGYTNGFKLSSPDGATWDIPVGVTESAFAANFDLINSVFYFSDDGMGEDTIAFGGSVMSNPGLSPLYSEIAFQISTALQPDDDGKMICLDSTFYPPTGQWLWAAPGGLTNPPEWGGPYCYTIDKCLGSTPDADGDGINDYCDVCPNDPDNDIDGDGFCGDVDNCPDDYNSDQIDSDLDGVGDSCDVCIGFDDTVDLDENGIPDACEKGLLGYWKLMEGSGTTGYDSSGFGTNLDLFGSPTWNTGGCETSLNFDGIDDYGYSECAPNFDIAGEITMAAWIRPIDINAGRYVLRIGTSDGGSIFSLDFYYGVIRFGGIYGNWSGNTLIEEGKWQHIAFTMTETDIKLYFNGQLDRTYNNPHTLSLKPCDVGVWIGRKGFYFKGNISHAQIYEKALTDQEMLDLYNSTYKNDLDNDGYCAGDDNCPDNYNPDQIDDDGDGVGDVCDQCPGFDDNVDSDGDGNADACDICPGFDDYADSDGDNVPDSCDICQGADDNADEDGDGVPNGCDECPGYADNVDTDEDGVPDGCDECEGFDDSIDTDSDEIPNGCDNCPDASNPNQADSDEDGIGDVCDPECNSPILLLTPADGVDVNRAIDFIWESQCGAGSFHIIIYDSTDAGINIHKEAYRYEPFTANYNAYIPGEYFWKVREKHEEIWTNWSDRNSFTILPPTVSLDPPTLLSPADGEKAISPQQFDWTDISGAFYYICEVKDDSTGDYLYQAAAPNSYAEFDLSTKFNVGDTGYWHVTVVNSDRVIASESSGYDLFVLSDSLPPIPDAPTNLDVDTNSFHGESVILSWDIAEHASEYEVQYSTDPAFPDNPSTFTRSDIVGTTTSLTWHTDMTLNWRVLASNISGSSGYTVGPVTVFPSRECVSNVYIDSPESITVEFGAPVQYGVLVAGECPGTVNGKWYFDGGEHETFTINGLSGSEVITSGLFPTDVAGTFEVFVEAVEGLDTMLSPPVYYTVNPPPPFGSPNTISVWAEPTGLLANGTDVSTLYVEVLDSAENLVEDDNITELTFSDLGDGSIPAGPHIVVGGLYDVTYTTGLTVEVVDITVSSPGLNPDIVRLTISNDELLLMKNHFLSLMPVLDLLNANYVQYQPELLSQYSTSNIWDFYIRFIDIAEPLADDTTAFRRLIMSLELLRQHYGHPLGYPLYDFDEDVTFTYGQDVAWSHAVTSLQLFITPIVTATDIGYSLIPPQPDVITYDPYLVRRVWLSALIGKTYAIVRQSSDFGNGDADWVADYVADAANSSTSQMVTHTKNALLAGYHPVNLLQSDSIRAKILSEYTLGEYILNSQNLLFEIDDSARFGTISVDLSTAQTAVADHLSEIKTLGSMKYGFVQSLNLMPTSAEFLYRMLAAPSDPTEKFYYVVDIANEVLKTETYQSGWSEPMSWCSDLHNSLNDAILLPFVGIPPKASDKSGDLLLATGDQNSLRIAPVNTEFIDKNLAKTGGDIDSYQEKISKIKDDISNSYYDELQTDGQILFDVSKDLTSELNILKGIIFASSYDANLSNPEFKKLNETLDSLIQMESGIRDLLNLYIVDFAFSTSSQFLKDLSLSQLDQALTAIEQLNTQLDEVFGYIYSSEAAPTLIVSDIETPNQILVADTSYTINLWVTNTGSLVADSVKVTYAIDEGGDYDPVDSKAGAVISILPGESAMFTVLTTFFADEFADADQIMWSTLSISPDLANGITVPTAFTFDYTKGGCCIGMRGNFDGDGEDAIDIADIVFMVDYQFLGSGVAPPCFEEGDIAPISGPNGEIDIEDLVRMVEYQFLEGPPPPGC